MPHLNRKKRLIADINVVPYIDVMLVLLIIFMITTPLLSQGIKIDLPKVPSEILPPENKPPVIVSIDKAGDFYLSFGENQDKPIDVETLLNRVAALLKYQPGTKILIAADNEVVYGRVAKAMALLQKAGVGNIGIVTRAPEPK